MPSGQDSNGSTGDSGGGPSFRDRLSSRFLKPVDPLAPHAPVAAQPTVEELQAADRTANDKERLFGLIAAPVAAAIALLVIDADTHNDPVQYLKNGALNPKYTPHSTYHTLLIVLLALSVIMLATAWFRKRLFLGMATALYGLALFNLHWWGFGVPFLLLGAWYLVRAYRAQQALKKATAGGAQSAGGGSSGGSPRASKRYTPPKPEGRQKAD